MRRLTSGWDQTCDSTLITGRKQLNSAVRQSHVNTVHTSYSQHRHRKKKKRKRKTLTLKHSHCPRRADWTTPPPIPPKPNWYTTIGMIIYSIHKWYRTAPFQNAKMCFSLLLHSRMIINKRKEGNKRMSSLHSFNQDADKYFQDPPAWQLFERQSLDYRQRQIWETQCSLAAFQSIWRFAYELCMSHYYYISAILE